jgi:hypothetical protein
MFILLLFLGSFLIFGNSQRCSQISVTHFSRDNDNSTLEGSAVLSVYKRNNIQYVSVSDYHAIKNDNETATLFCIPGSCSTNATTPFEATTVNGTIDMYVRFTTHQMYSLYYYGSVDDESFFETNGIMYTLDNPCVTILYNTSSYFLQETHCCLAFKPAPAVPSNTPRCKKFQSRSSLLNINDNYKIVATSNIIYNLDANNNITGTGNFSGPKNYSVRYSFNQNWFCENGNNYPSLNFTWYAFPSNIASKALITVSFAQWGSGGGIGTVSNLGRIIIENGKTLMEEGVPYTKTNDCIFWNSPPYTSQVINNQFCCTEFEDSLEKDDNVQFSSNVPHLPHPYFIKFYGKFKNN